MGQWHFEKTTLLSFFFFAIIAMAMNVKRKESISMLQEYG